MRDARNVPSGRRLSSTPAGKPVPPGLCAGGNSHPSVGLPARAFSPDNKGNNYIVVGSPIDTRPSFLFLDYCCVYFAACGTLYGKWRGTWSDIFPKIDLTVGYIHDTFKVDVLVREERVQELIAGKNGAGGMTAGDYLTACFAVPYTLLRSEAVQGGQPRQADQAEPL